MNDSNIVNLIKQQRHDDLIAVVEGELEISFVELFSEVDKICAALRQESIFEHHAVPRIGVQLPNGISYIVVALAALQSGACFVPIPDEFTDHERDDLISTTALHAVICEGPKDGGIKLPFELGTVQIDVLNASIPNFPEPEFNGLNPAFIRFSSGTTSRSKGVIISHQSLFDRINAANHGLQIGASTRVLWTLPMAHHFAVSIVLYLYFGATTVIETTHDPEEIYKAAKRSKANVLYGSPFHFAQLAQCSIASPLEHMRLAVATAASVSAEVAAAFQDRFELPLTQALGIIEVGLPVINTQHASDLPTALGQVQPAYDWKIQPTEADEQIGELLIKGPGLLDAYLIPWKTRSEITEDGWFHTGDNVEIINEENTLIMRGRGKSVINVGGIKVFPEEIEAVLNSHPQVDCSRVSANFHPTLGSFPIAEFLSNEADFDVKALRAYCQQRLAKYKIPLQFQQTDSIPLTANGKIKRHD